MLNLFSINLIHSKSSGDTTYYSNSTNGSTYLIDSKEILFKDLIKYLNQVNKLLSNPNILIKNYLANIYPEYFAEKYGIECQKETSSYSGTYSNIIVPLNTIFPPQLWGKNIYNNLLCYNYKLIDHYDMVNYPRNTFFEYIFKINFSSVNKLIIKNKLRLSFNKMK